jgi:hypothetical protein
MQPHREHVSRGRSQMTHPLNYRFNSVTKNGDYLQSEGRQAVYRWVKERSKGEGIGNE